jgi:23S rRNA (uracil1939-C5)-methyltransferase
MPDIVELYLTAMAHGGSALGRTARQVIFVPYTIPGERVRARIVDDRKRYAHAHLEEVLVPSPHRVEPPCPYYGDCGGCQFQHIAYPAQAAFKQDVVCDQLARIGGIEDAPVHDIIAADEPWAYRNQVQFGVSPEGLLGFQAAGSHEVVPIEDCLLTEPLLDDLWAALDMEWPQLARLSLRCGANTGDRLAVFELAEYQDFDIQVDFPVSCVLMLADGEPVVLMGDPFFHEEVAGRRYRVSAGSFFQVNTGAAQVLVELVDEALAPTGDETLLDLYCGVGLFGLALAERVGTLIGVEANPSAADDFHANASDLESDIALLEGPVEDVLPEVDEPVDSLVLDPPRAGAGPKVVQEIARLGPARIAYVSCDPATLARDARGLLDAGYDLAWIQPVDVFPQTYHIETVSLFLRRRG